MGAKTAGSRLCARWILALIAGVLLVTTVEELVPHADRPGTRRWASTTAFILGFVFIALLAAYVD